MAGRVRVKCAGLGREAGGAQLFVDLGPGLGPVRIFDITRRKLAFCDRDRGIALGTRAAEADTPVQINLSFGSLYDSRLVRIPGLLRKLFFAPGVGIADGEARRVGVGYPAILCRQRGFGRRHGRHARRGRASRNQKQDE